jgi:glycosyltransferase involved in cell wall biosynthesis
LTLPDVLLVFAVGIHLFVGVVVLVNAWYLRRPRTGSIPPPCRLSVLIPARNEEANIERLLTTLRAQDYPDFEVVLYDDGSEDRTWELIQEHAGPNVRAIRGEGPPEGWIGKVHALYQASRHATGDLYLFLDADIELLHEGALTELATRFHRLPSSSIMTGYPRFKGGGFLLVSMVPAAIFGGLPWPLVRRLPMRNLAAMNGQCWLLRAEDYHRHEPHNAHRDEILEDVEIGRYMKTHGVYPVMEDLQQDLGVYMYPDLKEAWKGFRKNAYLIMGGSPAPFLAVFLVYVGAYVVAPIFQPWLFVAVFGVKFVTDRLTRFPLWVTLFAPVSMVLAALVHVDSAIRFWTGTVDWKGRRVGQKVATP